MIGQTRIVQLNPTDRATALRIQKGIDNLLISRRGLLEQMAETACRNEGVFISSERIKDVSVLPDGNLQLVF
jgi:hypothetical protein